MNSPVTFNNVIVDLPHQSPIHHSWLINISSDESLIMEAIMKYFLKSHISDATSTEKSFG